MRLRHSVGLPYLVWLLILALGLSGCRSKTPPLSANVGPTLTDADVQKFADSLLKAAAANDTAAIGRMIDLAAMMDTALTDITMKPASRSSFLAGMKRAFNSPTGIAGQLPASIASGGSADLLRILTVDNQKRARFRIVFPKNAGVAYMDFVLARRANQQIEAVDIYQFATGELASQTIRRAAIPLAASENRGILARLSGADNAFVQNLPTLEAMAKALREGRNQDVLTSYQTLPDSLKQDKNVLLIRYRAAMEVGDQEHLRAIEDFRTYFPNDVCIDFLSIDYYIFRKQYDKSLEMVDRLDKAVGGDPYLNVMRAGIFAEAKRLPEARQAAEKAFQELPKNQQVCTILMGICLADRKYDLMPKLLDTLEQELRVPLNDLTTVPEYADFVQSPQYRQWMQARKHP